MKKDRLDSFSVPTSEREREADRLYIDLSEVETEVNSDRERGRLRSARFRKEHIRFPPYLSKNFSDFTILNEERRSA